VNSSIDKSYSQNKVISSSIGTTFDDLCKNWEQEAIIKFASVVTSNLGVKTRTKSYEKIIGLGEQALPLTVQKLKDGEYLFNRAVMTVLRDVTGDDIVKDDEIVTEQTISKRLIAYYEKKYLPTKKLKQKKESQIKTKQVKSQLIKPKKVTPEIALQYLQVTYAVYLDLGKKDSRFNKQAEQIKSILLSSQ